MIGPNLAALYAEAKPGCCCACDFPILRRKGGRGRKQKICGLPECWRVYHRAAGADRRHRETERKLNPPPPKSRARTSPIGASR